jgi:signal peptidase I
MCDSDTDPAGDCAMTLSDISRLAKSAWQWAREPMVSILFIVISTTAIAQPFYVPSGSMEPTIQIGDGLLGSKFPYGFSRYSLPIALGPHSENRLLGSAPKRGDVVIFRLPRDPGVVYVKRLIGLPGDRIQMIHARLFINGAMVTQTPDGAAQVEDQSGNMTMAARYVETLPGGARHPILKLAQEGRLDNTALFTVPPRQYFMMGDNRDNSLDSRVAAEAGGVGYVPAENLMARGDMVIGSYDFLNAHAVWQWLAAIRLDRFFHAIS